MTEENVVKEEKSVLIDGVECRTIKEMILYKMDRTLAICGLIAIGIIAILVKEVSPSASNVISLIAGGLTTYIGGKIIK